MQKPLTVHVDREFLRNIQRLDVQSEIDSRSCRPEGSSGYSTFELWTTRASLWISSGPFYFFQVVTPARSDREAPCSDS